MEIQYTASLKEDKSIFDTTEKSVAQKHDILREGADYSPQVICLGQSHILPALEEKLIDKELGKQYIIELGAEQAFGKKDARLLKVIPTTTFLKQKINPLPGLQVQIDGQIATIKHVGGGRCTVDFNHPLSGKDVVYEITIKRIIEEPKTKLENYLKHLFHHLPPLEIVGNSAKVKLPLPKEIEVKLQEQLKELQIGFETITFEKPEVNKV